MSNPDPFGDYANWLVRQMAIDHAAALDGWQPDERLTRLESLRLATALCAGGGGGPGGGVLRPGACADLAILSANPLTAQEADVLRIEVRRTYRRGEIAYSE